MSMVIKISAGKVRMMSSTSVTKLTSFKKLLQPMLRAHQGLVIIKVRQQQQQGLRQQQLQLHAVSDNSLLTKRQQKLCGHKLAPACRLSTIAAHVPPSPLVVVSFYKFADFPDYQAMKQPLKDLCEELHVSGGIILASEGINGSICGIRDTVEKVLGSIQSDDRLANLRRIESPATNEDEEIHNGHITRSPLGPDDDAPFRWGHVRVKLKEEIVTMGVPGVYPSKNVGKYVKPKDWNSLIQQTGTMVVDVRNAYEIRVGKFKGALDPETGSFREFPTWVEEHLLKHMDLDRPCAVGSEATTPAPQRIAMYCTGGIRCEKATSLLLSKGFTEVYHLEGGILKYLEEVPPAESMWEGECFVFDKRVSIEHGLKPGTYKLCYACKMPVSDDDMLSPAWEDGISCPHCIHIKSQKAKDRARARQRQFELWGAVSGPDKSRCIGHKQEKDFQGQSVFGSRIISICVMKN